MNTRRDCLGLLASGLVPARVGIAGLGSVAGTAASHASTAVAMGETVRWPEIRLMDGRLVGSPSATAAAHVIVFFSTTCPFCARHNDHVQRLFERARGQPLRVVGVAEDREDRRVRTYLERRGLGFDVSMDDELLRPALTQMKGIPLTCVIDRQQRLREVIRGEMFEADVLDLLKWARA